MQNKKDIRNKVENLRDEKDRITSEFLRQRDVLQGKFETKIECINDQIDYLRNIISKK